MSRVIGNEIFKTIVTMAYEMKLAAQVLERMAQRREKVLKLMREGQTFRDDEDIRKEIDKYLAISPDNKKHWRFEEEVEGGQNGFVLKKEIALSVSGRYRIMLSIVKHTEFRGHPRQVVRPALYVHILDSAGEEMNFDYARGDFIQTPATVDDVALVKLLGLCLEWEEVKEAYDDIYAMMPYKRTGKNTRTWNRWITEMSSNRKHSMLAKMIKVRYGEDV